MGSKYTVTAGIGNRVKYYYGTEYLVIALYKLWKIRVTFKLGVDTIYWKQLQIN